MCVLADFLWILTALNTWHFFPVENVPCSTGWTLKHYASSGTAIAAAFPWFWGLVELDLSPQDSPKGLCNISRDPKGWYCGCTSGQRYLTLNASKWILTCTHFFVHTFPWWRQSVPFTKICEGSQKNVSIGASSQKKNRALTQKIDRVVGVTGMKYTKFLWTQGFCALTRETGSKFEQHFETLSSISIEFLF